MTDRFLVFGHRGSPRRFPENTVASFEEALRAGADGFETDLRLLSDKTAVLFHDDEWLDAEIETLAADWIPTVGYDLARVRDLAQFANRATMVLEVKRAKWEEELLSEIAGFPNIIVASFDHSLIAELARRKVPFPLGITIYGRLVGCAEYMKRVGETYFFPQFRYAGREVVEELHENGMRVIPWSPNRERDWARLRDAGCDGVITDYPAEAVEWRKGLHTF